MANKLVLWVGGVVSVLLIAVVVVVLVLINTLNAQAEEQAYHECMARHGVAFDAPVPAGVSEDDYLDALIAAGDACIK